MTHKPNRRDVLKWSLAAGAVALPTTAIAAPATLPTRARASLVLRKDARHAVDSVLLRKI